VKLDLDARETGGAKIGRTAMHNASMAGHIDCGMSDAQTLVDHRSQ